MDGVADAVTRRVAAMPDDPALLGGRSATRRPTLRYGEDGVPTAYVPKGQRRTLPYGSPASAGRESVPELEIELELARASAGPFSDEGLERPSGIRLRCAPLRQEWYDLAGAAPVASGDERDRRRRGPR
jgi:hypothetical protein